MIELLSTAEMAEADRLTIAAGVAAYAKHLGLDLQSEAARRPG